VNRKVTGDMMAKSGNEISEGDGKKVPAEVGRELQGQAAWAGQDRFGPGRLVDVRAFAGTLRRDVNEIDLSLG
jgi:hypothetical protein